MNNRISSIPARLAVFSLFVLFPILSKAQTPIVSSRVTQAVDESKLATLTGNTHPLARPQNDRGPAPPSLPMERMLLVLKRSPEQELALDALLDQQQDSSSATYHQWLTPDQFGQQFGPSDQDVQAITDWLRSHGFQVARVSRGRTSIEFSGTASQVQEAFHTAIRRYSVNGEDHWANSSDPQIPSALTSVVAGINTLHNFPREAMHHVVGLALRAKANGEVSLEGPSLYNLGGTCGVPGVGCHAIGPFDFATIYNLLPLWNAAPTHIDGTGQTIAIVGESDINPQDVAAFRDYFGLPAANLQIIIDGPDPGIVPGDETESDLDVEWAGAIAPNAKIDFVTSESTETSLGVDLSAQYIVDNNLAPVLSESYGVCELFLGTAGNQFYNQLWQQAAAQGITVLVATGDSGSAVCDQTAGSSGAAQFGLSVSGFSSTPYNVAVGGTDFNDLTNPSTYWAPTNSAPLLPGNPSALATVSALSYIPETTWNDTCTNGVFGSILGFSTNPETNCNNSQLISAGFLTTVAGSGGKSSCTNSDGQSLSSCAGGYTKPTWQTGTGVPNDGRRDVPDVSLYAAINSPSGSFYVVCEADFNPGSISCDPTTPNTRFLGVGGTSASTPALAGIIALVNQETQSRQGNANYVLYKLATQQPVAFHDAPAGGTIAMPCVTGSTPDCITSLPGDKNGVLSGYSTTTGYDLATGLGSVDANNLVTKWSTVTAGSKATATSLTLSPAVSPIPHGTAVPINITVTPNPSSSSTPTGQVSLIVSTGQSAGNFTLASNGSLAPGTTTNLLPGGDYTVTAHYAGDGIFAPSDSTSSAVVVSPEDSKTQVLIEAFNSSTGQITNPNVTTISSGSSYLLKVNVNGISGTCAQNSGANPGCATGSVTVTDNDSPLATGTYKLNSQGYAEDQLLALQAGSHNLVATYGGDSSFNASTSLTDVVTVTKIPTIISLGAPSPQTTQSGTTVILTAAVTGQGGSPFPFPGPTGTVRFSVGSTPIQLGSSATVTYNSITITGGFTQLTATLSIFSLPNGADSITAQYLGDSNYAASPVSSPQQVQIQIPTSISLSSSNTSIPVGTSVTLTSRVTQSLSGGPLLTGTVKFTLFGVTGQVVGSAPVSGGQAQITTFALPAGNYSIWATYSGDANYASSSGSVTQSVVGLASVTSIASSNVTPAPASNVTFTAQVAPVLSGGPPLTGSVDFESPLGNSVALVAISNGQAQMTRAFPAETIAVVAVYHGDSNYAGSSAGVMETITPLGDSMVLTSSNLTIVQGTAVTFTAQITPTIPGGPDLTGGIVSFTANGSPIGTSAVSGTSPAQITTSSLPSGSIQIQAVFANSFYYASSSASITEIVTPVVVTPPPTFTVTANPTAISVSAPGQAGSTVLTLTSQNGLTGTNITVAAACTGLPSETTCSFSPTAAVTSTTITLPANGSTMATFYVLTTAPSSAVPTADNRPGGFGRWTLREITVPACAICGAMFLLGFRRKQFRRSTSLAMLTFAFVFATAACGGGGGSSSGGGGATGGGGGSGGNPGTPITQNAPITVSITIGGISQSVPNLTVTVQ